ncbi:hypothetical protein [Flavobacterium sp. KACC 22763]|uniref:hypothetical protein n=1 Tax=Flavobacterium sp. KACC 22763 TaxID=3025668 RepID=UPI002366F2F8|nr:hypothetical protein [Flavobacterium sp. KACC 22763]WDF62730.1 hypothetical protein PQ463_14000 [Flavobacterium sp. KACC 22763]
MKPLLKKSIFILVPFLLFLNCNSNQRSSRINLYSKDKSQAITIFSNYYDNERIIALGKLNAKPSIDYVKLEISEVTELGDEIGVCWFGEKKGWQLVSDGSKIVEVHLDTTKYKIRTKWYKDEDSIPNPKYYRDNNCFTIDMLPHSTIYPSENGYIERY